MSFVHGVSVCSYHMLANEAQFWLSIRDMQEAVAYESLDHSTTLAWNFEWSLTRRLRWLYSNKIPRDLAKILQKLFQSQEKFREISHPHVQSVETTLRHSSISGNEYFKKPLLPIIQLTSSGHTGQLTLETCPGGLDILLQH